jgi:hypothetical protein
MTRNQQIEKQVDAALSSLDQVARVSPAPFLFTRVQARLMREESSWWGRLSRTVARPAIAAGSMALVIMVNVLVIVRHTSAQITTGAPDHAEIAVADEYNRTNALYNIDNVQP